MFAFIQLAFGGDAVQRLPATGECARTLATASAGVDPGLGRVLCRISIERMGLVVALMGLVLIACTANRGTKFHEALALAFGSVGVLVASLREGAGSVDPACGHQSSGELMDVLAGLSGLAHGPGRGFRAHESVLLPDGLPARDDDRRFAGLGTAQRHGDAAADQLSTCRRRRP